jgi:NAD(P)-dependent dehydrogenase (short-subunit alcohol dehydrogenase family)
VSRHEGRTAVITGAALGLGREYARRLDERAGATLTTPRRAAVRQLTAEAESVLRF